MNRRDKDIFIEIGFIVSMVVVVFASYYGARFICKKPDVYEKVFFS